MKSYTIIKNGRKSGRKEHFFLIIVILGINKKQYLCSRF